MPWGPWTQEQGLERPFLIGGPLPPVLPAEGTILGFSVISSQEGCESERHILWLGTLPAHDPPLSSAHRLAQLDIDGHLAQCLADSTDDIEW